MKVIRTPEDHYFEGGLVKFSTSRNDGELYYEITLWNNDKTQSNTTPKEKVKNESELKEFQGKEIEN